MLADENRSKTFLGKGKIGKIFGGVEIGGKSETRWKSETRGKCIIASGGWTPLEKETENRKRNRNWSKR